MTEMVSVKEAKGLIQLHTKPLQPIRIDLQEAIGFTLAEDVYAPVNVPLFSQSAMDGYCFRFDDFLSSNALTIRGEIQAGNPAYLSLLPNTSMRIFTGAPMPDGADTVAMQEKVLVQNNVLIIDDFSLQKGSNVRLCGSEIKQGEKALQNETVLTPAAIGFLASMGITKVSVYRKASVTIIVTGKEVKQPGTALQRGEIYDANSFIIKSALQQRGIDNVTIVYTNDIKEEVNSALSHALEQSDIVLFSGGISTGKYDFVLAATEACNVQNVFYKVNQKPGKPLYFGTKTNTLVFGLPGNPAALLICLYEYVLPSLAKLFLSKNKLTKNLLPIKKDYTKKKGISLFLKGKCNDKQVEVLPAQESYKLSSFALANCLIFLDENITFVPAGELVEVHLL